MSMQATIIGLGAAGNKAAITLIEKEIISKDYIKLMNTTPMDIPEEYKSDSDLFYLFSSGLGGAGKESSKGRSSIIKAIKDRQIILDDMLNEDSKEVILVSSVEGGTGSGSVPVVSKYFDSMNIPVHVFAFIGFQDEARGINNTLKFFKDLPSNVILHTIVNSHFLDYTKNYSKAEQAANEEFANQIEILLGQKLVQSKQNIDGTDLYKINAQPGYMTISHIPLNGIKNVEGFNSAISKVFEDPSYMDNDQSAKRIAVMINASQKVQEAIDNSFEVVKRYVGVPIETFQHIQPDDDNDLRGDEYIDIIACGMNFPEKSIKDMNVKYNKLKEKLNVTRKSFADIYDDIDLDSEVDNFNMDIKRKTNAAKVEELFADDIKNNDILSSHDDIVVNTQSKPQHQQNHQQPLVNNKSSKSPITSSPQETKIDVSDLKRHRFTNTTINQDIYGNEYFNPDEDNSSQRINPMDNYNIYR